MSCISLISSEIVNAVLSDNKSHHFRIIPYNLAPGSQNMAFDRFFSRICTIKSDPVIRFYGWTPYCISIGRHQNEDILNIDRIRESGYDYVKRPTGGRAIFHANELTYSVVMPRHLSDHRALYIYMHNLIKSALNDLGYAVVMDEGKNILPRIRQDAVDFPCFTRSAFSEIQFNGKKVVGSAQRIYPNSVLQHGSILIGSEHENISNFLVGEPRQFSLIKQELKNNTVCLKQIKPEKILPEKVTKSIVKQLELRENISVYFKNISKSEMETSRLY